MNESNIVNREIKYMIYFYFFYFFTYANTVNRTWFIKNMISYFNNNLYGLKLLIILESTSFFFLAI